MTLTEKQSEIAVRNMDGSLYSPPEGAVLLIHRSILMVVHKDHPIVLIAEDDRVARPFTLQFFNEDGSIRGCHGSQSPGMP